MSTLRPTKPSERWLKQGEMLTRLKATHEASSPGTWMGHYRSKLRHEFGFSERSEQLSRQLWELWTFALDHGHRATAERLQDRHPHVNDLVAALKLLKQEVS